MLTRITVGTRPRIRRPAASRSGKITRRRSTYPRREPVQTNRATSLLPVWRSPFIVPKLARWQEEGRSAKLSHYSWTTPGLDGSA